MTKSTSDNTDPACRQEAVAFEILRPKEASHYTRIPESTLAKLRMRANRGRGPRFIKLSGTIIYRRSDLDAWMDGNVVES